MIDAITILVLLGHLHSVLHAKINGRFDDLGSKLERIEEQLTNSKTLERRR